MRRIFSLVLSVSLTASCFAQEPDNPEPTDDVPSLRPQLVLNTSGHTSRVMNLGFTHDDKQLVTVGRDHTIRYWDAVSGEPRRVIRLFADAFTSGGDQTAVFANGGRTLMLSRSPGPEEKGEKPRLLFLNVLEGRVDRVVKLDEWKPHAGIHFMALSPDGSRAALSAGGGASVYDTQTGKLLHSLAVKGPGQRLAFSPNSKQLAFRAGNGVHVYNSTTGGRENFLKFGGEAHALTWSPNGDKIYLGHDVGIDEWNVKEEKKERQFGVGRTLGMAWAGPNELLTVGQKPGFVGARISSLNLVTGEKQVRYPMAGDEGAARFYLIAPSKDGNRVAGVGSGQTIHLWEKGTEGPSLKATMQGRASQFYAAGWGKDGKTIAWGQTFHPKHKDLAERQPLERVFDLANLRLVPRPDPGKEPDGFKKYHEVLDGHSRRLLELDGVALRTELDASVVRDGKPLPLIPNAKIVYRGGTLLPGNRVILPMQGGALAFMDTQTGKQRCRVSAHSDAVMDTVASPDSRFLLTASRDQTMKIMSLTRIAETAPLITDEKATLLTLFAAGEDWIIWTPQGYYAATPGGEKLMGWRVHNPKGHPDDFYPAERFRKVLYRPDVIKLVLEKGSVEEAVKAANAKAQIKTETPVDVDNLVPPRVKLERVGDPGAKIRIKVTYEGTKTQPVRSLQLRLDGRSFPDPDGKYALAVKPGSLTATIEKEVDMPPGKHELKVLVRGKDTSDISEPLLNRAPLPPHMQPALHVVSVGINTYRDTTMELKAAVNDARDISAALTKHCVGPNNLFGKATGQPLLNPKRDEVLKALRDVRTVHKAKPGDLLVFFFAGHGIRDDKTGEFYLLTQEADTRNLARTALSGKELHDVMKDMPCQVLLIFDACQSAAGLAAFRPTDELSRKMTDEEAAVTVLVAAMAHEYSEEVNGNGRFTLALKHALEAKPGIGYDPYEQVMYIHHIYTYAYAEVRKESKGKQNPALLTPWTVSPLVIRTAPQTVASKP